MTEGTLVQVSGFKSRVVRRGRDHGRHPVTLVEGGDTFVAEPLDATEPAGHRGARSTTRTRR